VIGLGWWGRNVLGTPEQPKGDEWTLAVGDPIEAWRVWKVVQRHGVWTLSGIYMTVHWPSRRALRAVCMTNHSGVVKARRNLELDAVLPAIGAHPARSPCDPPNLTGHCPCGIHGVKTCKQLEAWRGTALKRGWLPDEGIFMAEGTVKLWGRVYRAELGFRAQFAYPAAFTLVIVPGWDISEVVDELADRYGVPVAVREAPELMPAPQEDAA
jgi:hypothetical protein